MKSLALTIFASFGLLSHAGVVAAASEPGAPASPGVALPACLTTAVGQDRTVIADCVHRHVEERGAAGIVELLDARERLVSGGFIYVLQEAKGLNDPAIASRVEIIAAGNDYESLAAAQMLATLSPASAWRVALARLETIRDESPPTVARSALSPIGEFEPPLNPLWFLRRLDWKTAPPGVLAQALTVLEARFPSELDTRFSCGNSIGNVQEYGTVLPLLVEIGTPAVPLLHRLAKSDDDLVRRNALFTLSAIPDEANAALFEAALGDRNAGLRKLAIWLTFATTGCAAAERFERLVEDPALPVRHRAVQALVDCGRPSAIPALLQMLPVAREAAVVFSSPLEPEYFERSEPQSPQQLLEQLAFVSAERDEADERAGEVAPRERAEWTAWWQALGEQFEPVAALRQRLDDCAAGHDAACEAVSTEGLALAARVGDLALLLAMRKASEGLRRSHLAPWSARHALEVRLGVADLPGEALDATADERDREAALGQLCRSDEEACAPIVFKLLMRTTEPDGRVAERHVNSLDPEQRREAGFHLARATEPSIIGRGYGVLAPLLRTADCEQLARLVADDAAPWLRRVGTTTLAACPAASPIARSSRDPPLRRVGGTDHTVLRRQR